MYFFVPFLLSIGHSLSRGGAWDSTSILNSCRVESYTSRRICVLGTFGVTLRSHEVPDSTSQYALGPLSNVAHTKRSGTRPPPHHQKDSLRVDVGARCSSRRLTFKYAVHTGTACVSDSDGSTQHRNRHTRGLTINAINWAIRKRVSCCSFFIVKPFFRAAMPNHPRRKSIVGAL
jgi:hypothetical protein